MALEVRFCAALSPLINQFSSKNQETCRHFMEVLCLKEEQ